MMAGFTGSPKGPSPPATPTGASASPQRNAWRFLWMYSAFSHSRQPSVA